MKYFLKTFFILIFFVGAYLVTRQLFNSTQDPFLLRVIRRVPVPVKKSLLTYVIAHEYPQINDKNTSDTEKAYILREFVFKSIPRDYIEEPSSKYYQGEDVWDIFLYANIARVGTGCAGVSYALMKLYHLYGFESYSYHVGHRDVYQHTLTLVKLKVNNNTVWAIQDPSYNLAFFNKNKEVYDIRDLSENFNEGNMDMLLIQGKVKKHPVVCDDDFFRCFTNRREFFSTQIQSSEPSVDRIYESRRFFLHPRHLTAEPGVAGTLALQRDILKKLNLSAFYSF